MNKYLEIEKNLSQWFLDNNYKGFDPYQLDEKASGFLSKIPFRKQIRSILKPFHVFIPSFHFGSLDKIYHPKAVGLIIGGNSFHYSITRQKELLSERIFIGISFRTFFRGEQYPVKTEEGKWTRKLQENRRDLCILPSNPFLPGKILSL